MFMRVITFVEDPVPHISNQHSPIANLLMWGTAMRRIN